MFCQRALIAMAVALLLAACTAPSPPPSSAGPLTATIYVIDRGWHTDIGLPANEISRPLAALESGFPGVRYLTLGFGERAYLTSRQVTVGQTLRALLPSQSAMLVTALKAPPAAAFGAGNVVVLHVTADGLANLQATIWDDLEHSAAGEPAMLGRGPYVGSEFYASRGTYDMFHTCNTWTAQMLDAAGLPVSASGVIFAGQVMRAARGVATAQASVGDR